MINKSGAVSHAVGIVEAAISSGAVKLHGAVSNDDPSTMASKDAAYLSTLIKELAETIYEQANRK